MKRLLTLLVVLFLWTSGSWATTTLINPAGDGGFENGATPAANSWYDLNNAPDSWIVNSVCVPFSGTKCAYVSSGSAAFTYSLISTIEHLYYKDVTIPAGEPKVTISFKWKAGGEGSTTSDWDNMKVFFGKSADMGTPVVNTAISSAYQISGPGAVNGMYKLNSATWNSESITVVGTPGATYRLVFSWKSDISDIANPPCAIDEVSMVSNPMGTIVSASPGGLWSSPATWVGGVVPTADNVTISANTTVVVNQTATVIGNLVVDGKLQWITSTTPSGTVNVLSAPNITIGVNGQLLAHATYLLGATVKTAGDFTNNGIANFAAPSANLTFNGTSGTQTLGGTGTFIADQQGRGIIQNLLFTSLAACSISTTLPQNFVTMNLAQTASSLNTNGKLSIDNTAICYGGLINRSVYTATVNAMGAGYTSAPTVAFSAPAVAGGTTATGTANFDLATGTVRSITITNPGNGYQTAPTITLTGGGYTTIAAAVASVYQSFASGSVAQTQKSAIATITGGLNINSSQGVGSVFVTNGGVGYTSAPTVGFALPIGYQNLVTSGGAGYTAAPTVAFVGGGATTAATGTAIVCRGQVVSVNITAGGVGYTSTPTITLTGGGYTTIATAAVPAGMLPTATATIDAGLGMVTGFTVTNAGFGYLLTFPAITLTGGGFTTAATGGTSRHGVYNLVYGWYLPAATNGIQTESAAIPANRRIHALTMGTAGYGATFTSALTLYGASPLPTFAGILDMSGTTLTFEHPSYTGASSSALNYFTNGKITYKLLGSTSSQSRLFPFNNYDGVGYYTSTLVTGIGATVATDGCTITTLTASMAGAPTAANMIGTRTLRLETNGFYGNSPSLRVGFNTVDALAGVSDYLTLAEAPALTGAWTIRSAPTITGLAIPANGSRVTSTVTVPICIVSTGNDYFGWNYTPPSCPVPTAGTSTPSNYSAILNWTNGGTETLWNLKYNIGSFDPTLAGTPVNGIAAHPYTLNPPLVPGTTYVWYVQADCGSGTTSTWSGPFTFTTPCLSNTTFPWTEGFEGMPAYGSKILPTCWSYENVAGTSGPYTANTTGSYNGPNGGVGFAYTYYANTTWMYTPSMHLTAGTSYDFSFYMMNKSVTSPIDFLMDVAYGTSNTNAGMTHVLATGVVCSNSAYTLFKYTITPATGDYFFGVKTTSATSTPWYISFDDFRLEVTPSCSAPTAVNTTAITTNSASINWSAPVIAPGSGYQIYYSTSATAPVAGTTPTGSVGAGVLTFPTGAVLTANTTYYVWVRSNCGAGLTSSWTAQSLPFTTLCDATVLPYTQNFDGVMAPAIPACMSVTNDNADAYPWKTNEYYPRSAPNSMYVGYNSLMATDDWFFTQGLTLAAGSYKVSFWYRGSSSYPEKLAVKFGNAPNAAGMTSAAIFDQTFTSAVYAEGVGLMTIVSPGTYYVGWHAYSDADMFYIAVDDISITEYLTGGLRGTVLNPLAAGIVGATVTAGTNVTTTTTGGAYSFDAVEPGTYSVSAAKDGYTTQTVPGVVINVGETTTQNFSLAYNLAPPSNLQATTVNQYDVHLTWLAPGAVPDQWIKWDLGTNYNAIGNNAAAVFDVASRWPVANLTAYAGAYLKKVRFFPNEASCTYTIKVWKGVSPPVLLYSQVVVAPVIGAFNEVTLTPTTPILITGTEEFWFGYECNTTTGYPAGCDAGPQHEGLGNMMYWSGAWQTLYQVNPNLTYDWNIAGFISTNSAKGMEETLIPMQQVGTTDLVGLTGSSNPALKSGVSSVFTTDPKRDHAANGGTAINNTDVNSDGTRTPWTPTGYNVYRNTVKISGPTPITPLFYDDLSRPAGTYTYGVTAVYPQGESAPVTIPVTIYSCGTPTLNAPSAISSTSATFTWTPAAGTPASWFVEYGIAGFAHGSGITVPVTGTASLTVSTLSPGVTYDVYVRTNCGGGDLSPWTGPQTFTTTYACPAGSIAEAEVCGTDANGGCNATVPAWEPLVIGQTVCGTAQCNGTTRDTDWYTFEVTTPTNVTLGGTAEFGYALGLIDGRTGCPVAGLMVYATGLAGQYKEVTAALGVGTYYAWFAPSNYVTVITCGTLDKYWAKLTGSTACVQPVDLTAINVVPTGADLNWQSTSATKNIEWGPGVFAQGTGANTVLGWASNTYHIATTLGTTYTYFVQGVCAGGATTAWSGPYTFTTPFCELANQCNYTVEMTDSYGDGWNGNILGFKQNGVVVATFTMLDGAGPEIVTIPLCTGISTDIVVDVFGTWSAEVGFIVRDANSAVVYSHASGTTFTAATVFATFTTSCAPATKTLNLTGVLLQGLYNGGGTMRQATTDGVTPQWLAPVADHITVELHTFGDYPTLAAPAYTDVPLSTTGTATVTVAASLGGNYWITVKHNSHIETVSGTAKSFAGSVITQSFAAPADVYAGNLLLMGDLGYAIFGGDVTQDGIVDGGDMSIIENLANLASGGYLPEDCNGDGVIDGGDMNIIENNANVAAGAITP